MDLCPWVRIRPLLLFEGAFGMSFLDFADILLKLTFELRSVCFESRVVRAQKKVNSTFVFDYFQEIVGAEQYLNPLVSVLAVALHDDRSYLSHPVLLP